MIFACSTQDDYNLKAVRINDGWGYIIFNHNKIIIKQGVIPAIAENKSFKCKEDALQVGNLVLEKIKKKLPPTVTKKDLILLEIAIQ